MRKFFILSITIALIGCENEIEFNGDETPPRMVAYAILSADNNRHIIELTESKPIFFDRENRIFEVEPPKVNVNGVSISLNKEIETTDKVIHYSFDADISAGDKIEFSSNSDLYGNITANDIVPRSTTIKDAKTYWFQDGYANYLRTNITIDDIKGEDNFYRVVVYTKKDEPYNEWNGEWEEKEIYTDQEPLFSEIPITLKDDDPDLSYRIFSDKTFADDTYTLNLYFQEDKMIPINLPPLGADIPDDYIPIYDGQHYIRVEIQTISESLYRYLHSLELQANQDYTMEPLKIHSNIDGGYGVVSSYNSTRKTINLKY